MPRRRSWKPALVGVLLMASVIGGCLGPTRFRAFISNRTDLDHAVRVSLTAISNGTEAYNRTFDVEAQAKIPMEGFPPWRGNFSAWTRLDDGRTANVTLPSSRFCGACDVYVFIRDEYVSFGWGVT